MFIIVPAVLIGLSLLGIVIIVFRKFSYLQKLSPEGQHSLGPSIWHDLMPELFSATRNLRIREYMHHLLLEAEKFLRRIRLLFSHIDRLSESMIRKLKRVQRQSAATVQQQAEKVQVQPMSPAVSPISASDEIPAKKSARLSMELLKKDEQDLILSIARDPKDARLYLALGDIYVRMKELNDAKESYETVLKLEPENEKAKKKLSAVLEKLAKM